MIKGLLSILFLGALVGAFWGESNSNAFKVIMGNDEKNQIAVVDLSGTILGTSGSSNPFDETTAITPDHLQSTFESMRGNKNLKAIILRINSPGGSVTASEEIYQLIKQYRSELNIPIWASYSEIAASGGYYISLAADKIYAPATTLTGSIGVILQTINYSELASKYGVKSVTIKSGHNKDLLDPFEPVNEEQVALLQKTVDEAYDLFLDRVVESRKIGKNSLVELADGRVLSGKQAQAAGLIDQLGTFNDVVKEMKNQMSAPDSQLIVYGQRSFLESLLNGVAKKITLSEIDVKLLPDSQLKGIPAYLYMN